MSIETRPPRAQPDEPAPRAAARRLVPADRRPGRVRRIIVVAALLALLPGLISFAQMVVQPSDTTLSIRAVEWMRSNGARGLVNQIESIYYSLTAPATGGPGLKKLPGLPGATGALANAPRRHHHAYRPPNLRPILHPALPGEGVWHSTFVGGASNPPVLITSFRPDPNYPQLVAGVAWINARRTDLQLYPGAQEPAVTLPSRGPEEVPINLRSHLVATFNSAFKLSDSGGGVTLNGHTYAPMRDGQATIVKYRNGRVNIIAWPYGSAAPPDVVFARQNLPLIVENGHLNPNLSDGPEWGATLGNAIRVWRSGIGIDRHGDLIYAAAPIQTVASLAEILRHAGAIRAMELDINTYWPSFITYRRPGAVGAANLLSDMDRSPQRYLTPDDRDFFAVYLK
jgi:hypothetical protein